MKSVSKEEYEGVTMSFWETLGNILGLSYVIGTWIVGAIIAFFILKVIWDEFIPKKKTKEAKQDKIDMEDYREWKKNKEEQK